MNAKKQILILLLISGTFGIACAQFSAKHAIYTNGEVNIGNYWGGDLGLNYVYQEKYAFQLGLTSNMRKAKSTPEDFTIGWVGLALFNANTPLDHWVTYNASFGRVYKLNPSGTIRIVPSIGLGYNIYTKPENWEKILYDYPHFPINLGKNYNYSDANYHAVSLIINPKIEFPLTRYWGLTLSPMLQTSRNGTYIGIGFGSMIGLLRDKR